MNDDITIFEDGRRPGAMQRWSLEAENGKEIHCPLEAPKGTQPCQYLHFSPGETHFEHLTSRRVR